MAIFFYGTGTWCVSTGRQPPLEAQRAEGLRAVRLQLDLQQQSRALRGQALSASPACDVPVRDRGWKDRQNESYLLAMEPQTGRTMWRVVRPSQAVEGIAGSVHHAHAIRVPGTPGAADCRRRCDQRARSGHRQAVVAVGHLEPQTIAHWRRSRPRSPATASCWPAVESPPIYAIKAGGSGTLDDRAVARTSRETKERTADVPTPAFYDGDFFVSARSQGRPRVEPQTVRSSGASHALEGQAEASPLAADGKMYIIIFGGDAAVIDAADGKMLYTVSMDKPTEDEVVRASIVAAHGRLFIRTTRRLYASARPIRPARERKRHCGCGVPRRDRALHRGPSSRHKLRAGGQGTSPAKSKAPVKRNLPQLHFSRCCMRRLWVDRRFGFRAGRRTRARIPRSAVHRPRAARRAVAQAQPLQAALARFPGNQERLGFSAGHRRQL